MERGAKSHQCHFLDAVFAFVLKYPGVQAQSDTASLPAAEEEPELLGSLQGPSVAHPL